MWGTCGGFIEFKKKKAQREMRCRCRCRWGSYLGLFGRSLRGRDFLRGRAGGGKNAEDPETVPCCVIARFVGKRELGTYERGGGGWGLPSALYHTK